jgi:RsiW-degrading membrane proteinase PrsW (M82 family)
VYPVSDATVTLGRDLHNNVVLLDPAVSRYQALLERGVAEWTIANLSAQQPISIDSLPLAPGQAAALAPGATLRLGATSLEWLTPPEPGRLEATQGDRAGEAPPREAAALHMLTPGVTLQFAVRARASRRAWWGLAVAGLILLLAGGVLTFATVLLIGRQALGASGWGRIAAAVALPLVPTIAVALLVVLIDRYEREPLTLLLLAFSWGALIAIPLALFAERAVEGALSAPGASNPLIHSLFQSLSAGLFEEGVKGAGLILLLLVLRDQFDNVTDGIIYGLAIGAGFALIENYAYLALGPTSAFPGLVLDRILLSWLGHSTFSALFGAGLGLWRERHARRGHRRGRWR